MMVCVCVDLWFVRDGRASVKREFVLPAGFCILCAMSRVSALICAPFVEPRVLFV